MELHQLRYFVAVAEDLHFRRAAERLHVAQPAVSEQVRKLELDLGVQLFERTHRSVSLTDAGAALLDAVPRALRQLTSSLPAVLVDLESAPAWRLVDDVRRRRPDALVPDLRSHTCRPCQPRDRRVPAGPRASDDNAGRRALTRPRRPVRVIRWTR
jgi:DNA-binding MarR family transcriptional regulator